MKKPKLPADIQIRSLKAKGVTFAFMSEREAVQYLESNHCYFKLRAFRRPFARKADGTYIDLDFGCLRDLYIVDMRLRQTLLRLCADVDHHARILLMKAFDQSLEDGYEIIADFEAENGARVRAAYQAAERDPYYASLYRKSAGSVPLWTFIEIIDFSLFTRFFDFFAWQTHDKALIDESFRLMTVGQLRRMLEQGHPLLSELSSGTAAHRPNHSVMRALSQAGIPKHLRRRKMRCETLRRIVTLLYVYAHITPVSEMRAEQEEELRALAQRIRRHIHFYEGTPAIASSLLFLAACLDNLFPPRYTY